MYNVLKHGETNYIKWPFPLMLIFTIYVFVNQQTESFIYYLSKFTDSYIYFLLTSTSSVLPN